MSSLTNEELMIFIQKNAKELDVTAYEFGEKTKISTMGAHNILSGESKNPRRKTLVSMFEYLESKQVAKYKNTKEENLPLTEEPNQARYKPIINPTGVVPYYNVEISGAFNSSFEDLKEYIEFYIDYKPLNDCTAYLPYFGNSMYPMFKSGNTLAVKQINNFNIILWGEPHLVITNDNANNYRTVKCIYQHTDPSKIILRAKNPDFAGDIIVNKEDILSLFIVKGKIELNEL